MPDIFPGPPRERPDLSQFPDPNAVPASGTGEGVPPTANGGAVQSPFTPPADYTYFEAGVTVATVWDYGYGFAPVAGPANTCMKFWRKRGVRVMRVATWALSCWGNPPRAPHWDLQDQGNSVLVMKAIAVGMPGSMADGVPLYHAAGQYVWALQCPPGDDEPIYIPASLLQPASGKTLNPAEFLKYIIGPVQTPTGHSTQPLQF